MVVRSSAAARRAAAASHANYIPRCGAGPIARCIGACTALQLGSLGLVPVATCVTRRQLLATCYVHTRHFSFLLFDPVLQHVGHGARARPLWTMGYVAPRGSTGNGRQRHKRDRLFRCPPVPSRTQRRPHVPLGAVPKPSPPRPLARWPLHPARRNGHTPKHESLQNRAPRSRQASHREPAPTQAPPGRPDALCCVGESQGPT